MHNAWFRMYAEFATDAKVQMMSEADQRRLAMLFCIRCNGNETLQDEEVAFQLRVSIDEWRRTKALFVDKEFIDQGNNLLNWNKRQFLSDSSTERVRKHREDKKRQGNVSVTPPDTDTEADSTNTTEASVQDSKPPQLTVTRAEKLFAAARGALRLAGIQDYAFENPIHQHSMRELAVLHGITPKQFQATFVELSQKKGKRTNLGHVLSTIRNRLADAARLAPIPAGAALAANGTHAPSKTRGAIEELERLKNGYDVDPDRGHDGVPEIALLGSGSDAGT